MGDARGDCVMNDLGSMAAQIIHYDSVASAEVGCQALGHIRLEDDPLSWGSP